MQMCKSCYQWFSPSATPMDFRVCVLVFSIAWSIFRVGPGFESWSLQWRHNERDGISSHQPHDCLLHRLFGRRSKNTSKLRVTGLCAGNSPGTGEFPAQRASDAENVSIWWHHHALCQLKFEAARTLLVWNDSLYPWMIWTTPETNNGLSGHTTQ